MSSSTTTCRTYTYTRANHTSWWSIRGTVTASSASPKSSTGPWRHPMSDNRPPRYEEDGRIIYRASGLGMCEKMFVALAMGYDPKAHPAWFQEILDEGTANEPVIREMWDEETGIPTVGVSTV